MRYKKLGTMTRQDCYNPNVSLPLEWVGFRAVSVNLTL